MIDMRCGGCRRTPDEISEYVAMALAEGMTPEIYVANEEGTYDAITGKFLCDVCYIKYGMPSSPTGWKATPNNLKALGL